MDFTALFPKAEDDGKPETALINGKIIPLDSLEFFALPEKEFNQARWIDGGSAILFSTPSRCIAAIKIAVVNTRNTLRESVTVLSYIVSITAASEKFLIRNVVLNGAKLDCLHQEIPLDQIKDSFTSPIIPENLVDTIRTLAEHEVAGHEIARKEHDYEQYLAFRDGSFRQSVYLRKRCTPREGECAIAKTTHLLTSKNRSLSESVMRNAPHGCWTAKLGEIIIAKLHAKSRHVFLLENADDTHISALKAWSADMSFLGYPYPMVLADQLARVTNEEAQMLRVMLVSDKTTASIVVPEKASTDVHDVLEHILYGRTS